MKPPMVAIAVIASAIVAWTAAGIADVQPAQELGDAVESIVAESPCPSEWDFNSETTIDTVVRSCMKENVASLGGRTAVAYLDDSDLCDHIGVKASKEPKDSITEFKTCAEVAEWPAP